MKKNYKMIIAIFITLLFSISGTAYAVTKYLAADVGFTPNNSNWKVNNVDDALNSLYEEAKALNVEYMTFDSGSAISKSEAGTFYTKTITIPENQTKVYLYSSVSSTYSAMPPTISSDIITNQSTTLFGDIGISGVIANYSYLSIIETDGTSGEITINYNCGGNGKHIVQAILFYE